MRKHCLAIFSFLSVFCMTFSARGFMPTYPDDEEFTACSRVSSWDECAKDEAQRALRTVKQQYRTILTTPSILKWQTSAEKNTEMLRDMYDSWTAFRTRLCSLANKASMYVEPLVEEKVSCNLYYILHHRDHLNSILLLMTKKAPSLRQNFNFLKIYDHDAEYEECVSKNQRNCIDEELKRSSKAIKDYYKTFSEDEFVGKWNNGPDLKKGNYRDMYDSWVAYRNRMCSLAVWAYNDFYGAGTMKLNECLQFYNREKLETMENLLMVAHSSLDDGHEADGDSPEEHREFTTDRDDGGLAEGQTIMPLERNIDFGPANSGDELDSEEPQKSAEKQPKEEKRHIPAWAQ